MGLEFEDADLDQPRLDESKAAEYIGKKVLIGLTYLGHDEELIEQRQCVGTILTFSNEQGIRIRLQDSDEPFALPPDPHGIQVAQPGTYRLRSTGEEIVNPDFLATWTITKPAPKASDE
jgi:hypothetical protein